VELTIFGIGEAPISICSAANGDDRFQLCVRATGRVTDYLHTVKAGTTVGVRGPYNRGFPVERMRGRDVILIAGGLGLAPLRSLIQYIGYNRKDYGRVTILCGARNPSELLFTDEFDTWRNDFDIDFRVTVDRGEEGWSGKVGLVTTLFEELTVDPESTYAAVCGPPIMYRFVVKELQKKGVPDDRIFLSLERRMECGVGKCQHCAVGSKLVCVDGPVFSLREVRDLKEAFE
jgi:NAD(P)H-flavin reductase